MIFMDRSHSAFAIAWSACFVLWWAASGFADDPTQPVPERPVADNEIRQPAAVTPQPGGPAPPQAAAQPQDVAQPQDLQPPATQLAIRDQRIDPAKLLAKSAATLRQLATRASPEVVANVKQLADQLESYIPQLKHERVNLNSAWSGLDDGREELESLREALETQRRKLDTDLKTYEAKAKLAAVSPPLVPIESAIKGNATASRPVTVVVDDPGGHGNAPVLTQGVNFGNPTPAQTLWTTHNFAAAATCLALVSVLLLCVVIAKISKAETGQQTRDGASERWKSALPANGGEKGAQRGLDESVADEASRLQGAIMAAVSEVELVTKAEFSDGLDSLAKRLERWQTGPSDRDLPDASIPTSSSPLLSSGDQHSTRDLAAPSPVSDVVPPDSDDGSRSTGLSGTGTRAPSETSAAMGPLPVEVAPPAVLPRLPTANDSEDFAPPPNTQLSDEQAFRRQNKGLRGANLTKPTTPVQGQVREQEPVKSTADPSIAAIDETAARLTSELASMTASLRLA